MRTVTTSLCVIFVLLVGYSSVAAEYKRPPKAAGKPAASAADDDQEIVKSNDAFAFALYAKLAEAEKGNLFFSPASIHTALAMTYAGARANTKMQMHWVLALPKHALRVRVVHPWPQDRVHPAYKALLAKLKPGKDAGYELHVANALWGQKDYAWLDEFLKTTKDNYGAGLREVDFIKETEKARQTINAWVEDQTKEKIKELLKPGILNSLTRLVLTNAIYFKGDWASPFDKEATKDAPFKLSAEKSVDVPLMYQTDNFGYADDETSQVLSMPYEGDELSMVVILPKKVDGLADVAGKLTSVALTARIAKLQKREVRVYLPKFKMTSEFRLDKALTSMGMTDAFNARAADFSGMNGRKDLFISAVVHKAFVDVNEEGTEAAATAVVIAMKSAPPPPPVFRADHPFLFVIRHNKTGAILFMGRVMNPKG